MIEFVCHGLAMGPILTNLCMPIAWVVVQPSSNRCVTDALGVFEIASWYAQCCPMVSLELRYRYQRRRVNLCLFLFRISLSANPLCGGWCQEFSNSWNLLFQDNKFCKGSHKNYLLYFIGSCAKGSNEILQIQLPFFVVCRDNKMWW